MNYVFYLRFTYFALYVGNPKNEFIAHNIISNNFPFNLIISRFPKPKFVIYLELFIHYTLVLIKTKGTAFCCNTLYFVRIELFIFTLDEQIERLSLILPHRLQQFLLLLSLPTNLIRNLCD